MSGGTEKKLVYQSDFMEVFFLPGTASQLFVPFTSMGMYADGNTMWGERPATHLGLPTLGFISRRPNWYPVADMNNAISATGEILAAYPDKITFGGSMGGYAALKHGAALGASTAIAFAPQYSIDPSVVPDNFFVKHFDATIHRGMEIAANEPPPNSFVIFDPHEKEDAESFSLIKAAAPYVAPVFAPNVGHEAIRMYAGTQRLKDILDLATNGGREALQKHTHMLRRIKGQRAHGMAIAAILRRPRVALYLLEREVNELSPRSVIHIANTLGLKLLALGDKVTAKRAFELGLIRGENDASLLRGLQAAQ